MRSALRRNRKAGESAHAVLRLDDLVGTGPLFRECQCDPEVVDPGHEAEFIERQVHRDVPARFAVLAHGLDQLVQRVAGPVHHIASRTPALSLQLDEMVQRLRAVAFARDHQRGVLPHADPEHRIQEQTEQHAADERAADHRSQPIRRVARQVGKHLDTQTSPDRQADHERPARIEHA